MSLQQLLCILTFCIAATFRTRSAADGAKANISALSQLTEMKAGALLKRAVQLGIHEDALEKAGDADDLKSALIELIVAHTARDQDSHPNTVKRYVREGTPGESPQNLSQKQNDVLDRVPETMKEAENVMQSAWLGSWSWRRPFEGAQVSAELELHQKVKFVKGSLSFFKGECTYNSLRELPLITKVHECHEACLAKSHASDHHCKHDTCFCKAYSVSALQYSVPTQWPFGSSPFGSSSPVQCKLFGNKMIMNYTPDATRICFSPELHSMPELKFKQPDFNHSLVVLP